jgi:glycerol uptake facilitator-like aquaporin
MDVLWIYIAGPMTGAAMAALTYKFIRGEPS